MNKEEAAQYLGISVRSLERFTKVNRIGCRYEKNKTRLTPIYDEIDLARFKEELQRPIHRPVVRSMGDPETIPPGGDNNATALARVAESAVIERIIAATAQATAEAMATATPAAQPERPVVNVADKVLLTLDECRLLTGLSRQVLREAINGQKLKAQQIGRAWRIKRGDLDRYIKEL